MCILFTIYIGIVSKNKNIVILGAVFSLIIIILFLLSIYIISIYTRNLLIQLSGLIATITDKGSLEIFSAVEDNMFSKLQSQVLKLTGILKAKNTKIEGDRNEIKSLISDISHQLKTPISNLKMYSDLIQDETLLRSEKEEFQNIIKTSVLKLEFLVESMIKMSRLETGIILLKVEKCCLNETLLKAIKQIHKKAINKGINIDYSEKSKVYLNHDKNWTAEGIFNILDNAVKYTPYGGEININIESYEMFSKIDISDSGFGINEDELEKIFLRFYRSVDSRDVEGVGIGLYLSREIISRQDGYIKVNSSNKGSTFSIFLPN